MLPLLVFPLSLMSNKMGGEDKIQKMGKRLMHGGGLPCLTPSCKPAGGWKVFNARMEEPGGGWRRRIPDKFFQFSHNLLAKFPCALWVGSQDWLCTSFQPRRGGELYLRKWKSRPFLSSLFTLLILVWEFVSAWYGLEGESTRATSINKL